MSRRIGVNIVTREKEMEFYAQLINGEVMLLWEFMKFLMQLVNEAVCFSSDGQDNLPVLRLRDYRSAVFSSIYRIKRLLDDNIRTKQG